VGGLPELANLSGDGAGRVIGVLPVDDSDPASLLLATEVALQL